MLDLCFFQSKGYFLSGIVDKSKIQLYYVHIRDFTNVKKVYGNEKRFENQRR